MDDFADQPSDPAHRTTVSAKRLYVLSAVFAIMTVPAFFADLPVARFLMPKNGQEDSIPGDVRKISELSEFFGHGFGVGVILLTVVVLDRRRRRAFFRLFTCAYLPGLVNLGFKAVIARGRPNYWSKVGSLPADVWETFVGWFPHRLVEHLALAKPNDLESFASGHTTAAVGCAVGLSWLYPHGRVLFAMFALLAAAQRVVSGNHFVSDTCAGAALALLVGALCFDRRVLGRLFDRWENRGNPSWREVGQASEG